MKMQKRVVSSLGALGLVAGNQAMAALPPEVATGFTAIQADAEAMIALVWAVVIVITGAFVTFKIFKRGAAKT